MIRFPSALLTLSKVALVFVNVPVAGGCGEAVPTPASVPTRRNGMMTSKSLCALCIEPPSVLWTDRIPERERGRFAVERRQRSAPRAPTQQGGLQQVVAPAQAAHGDTRAPRRAGSRLEARRRGL